MLFGAADRNNEKRKSEDKAFKQAKQSWRNNEKIRTDEYFFAKDTRDAAIADNEANLRVKELQLLSDFDYTIERQDFEYDTAYRAYERSQDIANQQIGYNRMAEDNAIMEQNFKRRDDLLATMFDESDSALGYISQSSGLKLKKHSDYVQADLKEAQIESKYLGDMSNYKLERQKLRADAQNNTQKAIVAGMKLAGEIRSRGGSGRSAAKAVLGAMTESGATRSAIANSLMYAEQGLDIGMAQLKDMLILDQTMVMSMRDMADNEYTIKKGMVDATRDVDKIKIAASKRSIEDRDSIVRRMINQARRQADLNAEASVLLQPERLPPPPDPRELYAEYDDPSTEDYVEMLLRPTVTEFPEYRPMPEPERDNFFTGRENVGASNFGDLLKIGGMVATGISGMGAGLGMFSSTTGTAAAWGAAGTGLSTLSSSFYPKGY